MLVLAEPLEELEAAARPQVTAALDRAPLLEKPRDVGYGPSTTLLHRSDNRRCAMSDGRGAVTLVRTGADDWKALKVPGVSAKVLRRDADTGESTALVRFAAGARFPAHNHPAGEEVFVLEGEVLIGRDRLKAGDYLYTPPNGAHAASSEHGCVFLVTLPQPVEILEG